MGEIVCTFLCIYNDYFTFQKLLYLILIICTYGAALMTDF